MIRSALVHVDASGRPPNASIFSAGLGFRELGWDVAEMTGDRLLELSPSPEALVVGGVETVLPYLRKLNAQPAALDYPDALRPYLGRRLRRTTLGDVRSQVGSNSDPVFVKPVEHKLFDGHVVRSFRDLIGTARLPAETPVFETEVVEFLSEWRFYVSNGCVMGVGHYAGAATDFPEKALVLESVATFHETGHAPSAYGLDFGVCSDGTTRLVEVNDAITLGNYGLRPAQYARFLSARWEELLAPKTGDVW